MKFNTKLGATSNIFQVFVRDSSSTTGAGLTGLTNASASLVAYYHRDTDTTATSISLVSMTVGTFTSGGFKEIDATNMPGWYQFCPPDAAFASGAKNLALHLKGATNMAPLPFEIQLVGYDPQDAVRLGLTALPNAAAEASGGLYTRGTGAGQINQANNGQVDTNVIRIGGTSQTARDIGASVLLSAGTGTGQLDFTSGVVKANATQILGTAVSTPATAGILDVNLKNIANAAVSTSTAQLGVNAVNIGGTAQTGRDIGASVLLSSGTGSGQLDFTSGVVKANLIQILGTVLTETAGQIAGAFKQFFNIGSPTGTVNLIPAVTTVTTTTTATNLTNAPTVGDFTATMKTSLNNSTPASITGAVGSVTGAVGSVTGNVGGNVTGTVASVVGNVGGNVTGTVASVVGNVGGNVTGNVTGTVGSVVGNVGGNVVGTVASVVGNVGGNVVGSVASVTAAVTVGTNNDKTGYALSGASLLALADSVWDELLAGHLGAGSTGAALNAAGSAGDPWSTMLPGAYGAGTAGKIVGDNINATVSSRATPADVPSAAVVADAVWDEARAGHVSAGSFGQGVASVQGNVTGSAASVTGTVGSVTGNVGGNVVGSVASVTAAVTVGTNNDKTGYSLLAGQLFIKKNQALDNFMFIMVDGNNEPLTGLTVTAERSIDGATFAACANSPVELSDGVYTLDIAAADVNGAVIMFLFTATSAENCYVEMITQP